MTSKRKARKRKKFFTPAEANAALPLVKAIVQDIATLAHSLTDRQERVRRLGPLENNGLSEAHREEIQDVQTEMERDEDRMRDCMRELVELGIELKDPFTGLIDFPGWIDGHEVYLCWRLGEEEVGHWHELNKGFAGRQKLGVPVQST